MSEKGSGWSTGKLLAVVIPVCVVVASVAVTLILVLGKSDGEKTTGGETKPPTEEEVVQDYEQVQQDVETALKEMQDLQSQEAMADEVAYEQAVTEADAAIDQLVQDSAAAAEAIELASAEVASAAGEVTETQQQYQQMLTDVTAYYTYVEQLTQEAVAQLQYIQSTIPALTEIRQWQSLVTRIRQAPVTAQGNQLASQLAGRAEVALGKLGNTGQAPESLVAYGTGLQSLVQQMQGVSQQMAQALAGGDQAAFDQLDAQLSSMVGQTRQQLSGALEAAINGFDAQLNALSSQVSASMPKK